MSYLDELNKKKTPQSEPADPAQVKNSAGGYAWQVGDFERARRFLILGAEGGTYYIGQRQLIRENAEAVERCLTEDGKRMVDLIVEVSDGGLAPKNDEALFALALATAAPDVETRRYAWEQLPKVARIGTHLFTFATFRESVGGWGRSARRAMGGWYTGKSADELAYQMVKYRQRNGWTHRDILRLAHPSLEDVSDDPLKRQDHAKCFDFACDRLEGSFGIPQIIEGYRLAQDCESPQNSANLIREYKLPREAIQTDHLKSPEVWDALLNAGNGMPIGALLRNLRNMTKAGIVDAMSENEKTVIERLTDAEGLRKGRIHPMAILIAMRAYSGQRARGYGFYGGDTPEVAPNQRLVDALDEAFYMSFGNCEPSNKRTMLAVDCSGSMSQQISGSEFVDCRTAAGALALLAAKTEPQYLITGFTDGSGGWARRSTGITELSISPRQRLDDAARELDRHDWGGTDCALPMIHAEKNGLNIDTFYVYTDNDTWAGSVHPHQALESYRQKSGIDAKMVVVGMAGNGFSIANPSDPGMLDVVGMDASAPNMMSAFARGEI